jgi:enoyl-CoA hydratase
MTGDMIGADEALRLGLVNYLEANQEQALAKAESLLYKVFKKAPIAIAKVIACVNDAVNKPDHGYQTEYESFSSLFETEDLQEGVSAFLEKRKADFKGK